MTARSAALVVPAFRDWDDVAALLETLPSSIAGAPLRAVVVDDGSGDGGLDQLRRRQWHLDVRWLKRETNGGFGAAVNVGLTHAGDSDVIVLLNSDVRIAPESLAQLCDSAEATVGIHAPATVDASGNRAFVARRFPTIWTMLAEYFIPLRAVPPLDRRLRDFDLRASASRAPHRTEWLAGSCLAFVPAVVERIGKFDEGYHMYVEEVDWQRRAATYGVERWYHPEITALHTLARTRDPDQAGDQRFRWLWQARYRYLQRSGNPARLALLRVLMTVAFVCTMPVWALVFLLPGRRRQVATQMRRHWSVLWVEPAGTPRSP